MRTLTPRSASGPPKPARPSGRRSSPSQTSKPGKAALATSASRALPRPPAPLPALDSCATSSAAVAAQRCLPQVLLRARRRAEGLVVASLDDAGPPARMDPVGEPHAPCSGRRLTALTRTGGPARGPGCASAPAAPPWPRRQEGGREVEVEGRGHRSVRHSSMRVRARGEPALLNSTSRKPAMVGEDYRAHWLTTRRAAHEPPQGSRSERDPSIGGQLLGTTHWGCWA